jgi:acetyltransferase
MKNKIEKLNKIFNPKSLVIIGADAEPKSVGWGIVKNALEGKSKRKIFAVNPFIKNVLGLKCFPSVKDIRERVDLAVIAVPAKIVPRVVRECCEAKVGSMIIISAGFSETGKEGAEMEKEIKDMTEKAGIPVVGPNCLGIISCVNFLNASFSPGTPKAGEIAFISQSGALLDSVIDQNSQENYGFSHLVSYGNGADAGLIDFLSWLENDKDTKVICLYLEGLKEGREIIEALKKVSAKKPIIAIKAGKTDLGQKSALSHTGSLAGDYQIYRAIFRQSGVIEADSLRDMFTMAKALAWQPRSKNGIGIVTNGGGCGVLASDYCEEMGINIQRLSPRTVKILRDSKMIHSASAFSNPLDILGDASPGGYKTAINAVIAQSNINGLLVIQTLQIMTETDKNAKIIKEAGEKWKKPIVTAFLGGKITQSGIDILEKNRIPNYKDLKDAVLAVKSLLK